MLYHIYAQCHDSDGEVSHKDGVISTDKPIAGSADYDKFKAELAKQFGFPVDRVLICSMTYLPER